MLLILVSEEFTLIFFSRRTTVTFSPLSFEQLYSDTSNSDLHNGQPPQANKAVQFIRYLVFLTECEITTKNIIKIK